MTSTHKARPALFSASRQLMLGSAALATVLIVTQAGADLTQAEIDAARSHAYDLAGSGQCAQAMPIWERLARARSSAVDFIDAANCAVETGDAQRAVNNLWDAVRRRDQLSADQQLYALRALGYQAEAVGDWDKALIGWEYASRISGDGFDQLQAARASRLSGRVRSAEARLMEIDAGTLQGDQLASYYDERAQVLRQQQPAAAASYMERAIALDDQAWRRFDRALMLDAAGQTDAAIAEYRTVLSRDPGNMDVQLSLAYALRRTGGDAEAAELFRAVMARDPSRSDLNEDLGYALKDAGDREGASEAFRRAIDRLHSQGVSSDDERLTRFRNEVTELDRSVYGYAYYTWRDAGTSISNGVQTSAAYSSLGGEINWRPENLYQDGRGLSFYGRAYTAIDPGTFNFDGDSTQAGLGVRYKPFSAHDFSLSAERLVALGDDARDDWLLRASYGWTDGYGWEGREDSWNYTSLYADLAYIPGDDEFFGAYLQARQGRRFPVADNWAVTPYMTVIGQYADDNFGSQEQWEAGPGVAFTHWFDEDRYHSARKRVDFEVEYLFDVDGGNDDGVMARVVFGF